MDLAIEFIKSLCIGYIGILKGWKWNIKYWIIVFAVAAIMLLTSISIGAENMVKLIISM